MNPSEESCLGALILVVLCTRPKLLRYFTLQLNSVINSIISFSTFWSHWIPPHINNAISIYESDTVNYSRVSFFPPTFPIALSLSLFILFLLEILQTDFHFRASPISVELRKIYIIEESNEQKIDSTKFPMGIKISIRAERALTYVFSFWGFDFHVDLCQYQILAILLSIIIAKAWQKLNVTHAHQMDWERQYIAGFFLRITNNWRFMFLKKRSRECPWWWCVRAIH